MERILVGFALLYVPFFFFFTLKAQLKAGSPGSCCNWPGERWWGLKWSLSWRGQKGRQQYKIERCKYQNLAFWHERNGGDRMLGAAEWADGLGLVMDQNLQRWMKMNQLAEKMSLPRSILLGRSFLMLLSSSLYYFRLYRFSKKHWDFNNEISESSKKFNGEGTVT